MDDSTHDADEQFDRGEPRTYAIPLAKTLNSISRLDLPGYNPDEVDERNTPEAIFDLRDTIEDELIGPSVRVWQDTDDFIRLTFPNPRRDYDDPLADCIHLELGYYSDGRVKVLNASYSNGRTADGKATSHTFYKGWLDDYDRERAFIAGMEAAKHLHVDYIRAGLSPTQALDFGVTTGLGYPFHSWTMRRDVGYEAGRKNRANARDTLRDLGWDDNITERDADIARCHVCNNNQQAEPGCDPDRTLVLKDGDSFDPVPYGEERKFTDEEYKQEAYDERNRKDAPDEPCSDCGAHPGHYHHEGCDWEQCPRCDEQLLSCDCPWRTKESIA